MQRLRDQTSSPDPATARAAALLSAMPPLDAARLRRPPLPGPEVARRAGAGRLRTALVIAMTLGSVGAAAATLRGATWLRGARGADVQGHAVTAGAGQASRASPHQGARGAGVDDALSEVAVAPQPATAVVAPADRAPQPAGDLVTDPAARHVDAPRAGAPRSTPGGQPRSASKETARTGAARAIADESALMVGAVRALRRDGDPARAQALAEESLQKYPHGVQVEEAMALAMEAASANRDEAAARQAARRYVANFPSGRFTDRAQRILGSPPR